MSEEGNWRAFIRRHWGAFAIFILAAALIFAGGVYVFWWFAGSAVSSNLVPSTLGFWTIGDMIAFVLYLIFWELVLIGIPAAIGAGLGWWWWKSLPSEERAGYHFGRHGRSAGGSGGVGFLIFLGFCLKVYLDGNWNVPVANFTLAYIVGSVITVMIWGLVIFGIPAAIALAWWLRREMKKP